MANFIATWSGRYPRLCDGKWTIYRNGVNVSIFIPSSLRNEPMHTRKRYVTWNFASDWSEKWDFYWDGLSAKKWIRKNHYWIRRICLSEEEEFQLFHAINAADWRHGSCGGCI